MNFNGSKNHRSTYLSSRVLPSVLQKIFHQDRKSSPKDKPRTTKEETEENITRIEVIHENLLLPFSCRQRIDPSFTNEASSLATVTAGKHRSITGPVTNITRRYTSRYYNLHADPPSSSLSLSPQFINSKLNISSLTIKCSKNPTRKEQFLSPSHIYTYIHPYIQTYIYTHTYDRERI